MPIAEVGGSKIPVRVGAKRVNVKKTRNDGTTYDAQRSVRVAAKSGKEF
jgi:large subunit ribosomal protein L24